MKAKVYYNSACPVCDAGIARQRGRMDACRAGGGVAWVDIDGASDALAARGVGLEAVRRKLYLVDEGGTMHVGAAAFARLWQATPGQRWLGHLIALPGIALVARLGYDAFADVLYRWNRRKGRW